MIILDSNVWIALFSKKDSQNTRAEKFYDEIEGGIIVPEYVILETVSIVSVKVSKKTADGFLEYILNNKDIYILYSNEDFLGEVLNFYRKISNNHLSFVDVTLLCLAKYYQVVTFDKKLDREINNYNDAGN